MWRRLYGVAAAGNGQTAAQRYAESHKKGWWVLLQASVEVEHVFHA